jgi:hypothetical protein
MYSPEARVSSARAWVAVLSWLACLVVIVGVGAPAIAFARSNGLAPFSVPAAVVFEGTSEYDITFRVPAAATAEISVAEVAAHQPVRLATVFAQLHATRDVTLGSGGVGTAPAQIVRTIGKGEKVADIIAEGKALTYATGNEHALISLTTGQRVIVSGGQGGIDLSGMAVRRVLGHSHLPRPVDRRTSVLCSSSGNEARTCWSTAF